MINNRKIISFFDENHERIPGVVYSFDNRLKDINAIQMSSLFAKTNKVLQGYNIVCARVEVFQNNAITGLTEKQRIIRKT